MRAIYLPYDINEKSELISITGERAHHLNVARVKIGEALLLLNGQGMTVTGEVLSISKSIVEVRIRDIKSTVPSHEISLAIANPKKDAFEDILKFSVELGIKNIYPLTSDYSQYDYVSSDRVLRLIESAIIQSNNPFSPHIFPQNTLKNFLSLHQDDIYFFNSQISAHAGTSIKNPKVKTILIGPEGGFSNQEIAEILKYPKIHEIHLPTPIMRAPTAVASSVGYLLASEFSPK